MPCTSFVPCPSIAAWACRGSWDTTAGSVGVCHSVKPCQSHRHTHTHTNHTMRLLLVWYQFIVLLVFCSRGCLLIRCDKYPYICSHCRLVSETIIIIIITNVLLQHSICQRNILFLEDNSRSHPVVIIYVHILLYYLQILPLPQHHPDLCQPKLIDHNIVFSAFSHQKSDGHEPLYNVTM